MTSGPGRVLPERRAGLLFLVGDMIVFNARALRNLKYARAFLSEAIRPPPH